MCNICPKWVLTLLLLLSLAQSMLQCVITEETLLSRLRHASGSTNTQLDSVVWNSQPSVRFHCKLVISKSKMQFPGDRVAYLVLQAGAIQKSTPLPRQISPHPMAYHCFYFICFIYLLAEGTTSAHANTGKRGQSEPFFRCVPVSCSLAPVIMGSRCSWVDPSLPSAGADSRDLCVKHADNPSL